ncbi:DUF5133 domain-containing protein [Streptomyces sp. NPDC048257]|uniref:DUF5133 domain-containing protein n=1 Tax=Streptomyces sp. NPDC048257 TaxID=3365526 RepID=UPI0037163268
MASTPPPQSPAATPAPTGTGADPMAAQAAVGRATGVLMALVPCTADTARRIIVDTAQAAATTPQTMADAVVAMFTDRYVVPSLERALHTAIARAQTPPAPVAGTSPRLLPNTFALRRHLNHLRAARRRALSSPDDPGARRDLDDAAYTLCVLMGQRGTHAALLAAEAYLAQHRLPPTPG